MSDTALLQDRLEEAPTGPRTFAAGVALVSFASLLLELALTRLFSVVLFYHFAFLAISIALLGLGAGGVFAYVRRNWLARWETRPIAWAVCAVNAIAIVGVLEVVLWVPVSLEISWANFGRLTVIYLAATVPFFLTGLLFSIVFARESGRIAQLYGADLAGASASCLAVVPLLNWMGGPNAVLAAAAAMALAAMLWAPETRPRRAALGLALALVALLAWNHDGRLIDIVFAKGMRRDQPWVLFAKWNAISRVEVNEAGGARYVVIDADASTAIMNLDPHAPAAEERRRLMNSPAAVVNVLRPQGKYAIIGPGGGVDVLRAVAGGSKDVTGIDINPIIVNDIMRGGYADYAHHLYEIPEVQVHVSEGRSWVRGSREQYDVIQMTLVDTWASTAAGALALSENNLYTLEAFREYFDHLKPDGMLAITRWEFRQPREALRVVAQGIAVLHARGLADCSAHFAVLASGPLEEDGRAVTVVMKKSPFTAQEEAAVRTHAAANPGLAELYLPSDGDRVATSPSSQPGPYSFAALITSRDTRSFTRTYAYNISPVGDDAPFFFFTLKTGQALRAVFSVSGKAPVDWKNNLGIVVLGMLLLISLVAVLAFLILPLAIHQQAREQPILPLLYFVAVGLGYIMIEIALIQRFVLFLGHPTYALTVVVFLMLLASGAGSVVSRRLLRSPIHVRWILAVIIALAGLYVWTLPLLLGRLVGLPFVGKLLLSAALIVPLALAMGMPFPTGLRALSPTTRPAALLHNVSTVEWAWAMNAAASVLGSVLAMMLAIHFGLGLALASAAAAYLLSALLTASWRARFA